MRGGVVITVTVRHHISAGHRIAGLDGPGAKCAHPHGHTFGISWTFQVPDTTAQAVEFAGVKKLLRGWVDDRMDHGFFICETDLAMLEVWVDNRWKHYLLPQPSTTEGIAAELAAITRQLLPDLTLLTVEVTEGPHNAAAWHA